MIQREQGYEEHFALGSKDFHSPGQVLALVQALELRWRDYAVKINLKRPGKSFDLLLMKQPSNNTPLIGEWKYAVVGVLGDEAVRKRFCSAPRRKNDQEIETRTEQESRLIASTLNEILQEPVELVAHGFKTEKDFDSEIFLDPDFTPLGTIPTTLFCMRALDHLSNPNGHNPKERFYTRIFRPDQIEAYTLFSNAFGHSHTRFDLSYDNRDVSFLTERGTVIQKSNLPDLYSGILELFLVKPQKAPIHVNLNGENYEDSKDLSELESSLPVPSFLMELTRRLDEARRQQS